MQAALTAAYFCSGKIGLAYAVVQANATAIWPPTGIGMAAAMALGPRVWPAVFVGAFLVNVTTAGTVLTSLGIAAGNSFEAVVGAALVRRFAGGVECFSRPADVFRFAVLAGLASTTISATVGVTTLALAGYAAWAAYGSIWLTWWLGDVAGALVITPLLVLWSRPFRLSALRDRVIETVILTATVIAVSAVVFGGMLPSGLAHQPIAFLCIPPLVWSAVRFGPREAATAIVLFAGIAVAGTLHGFGPFAVVAPNESLLLVQGFVATMAVMVQVVAALVWERQRGERALQRSEARANVLAEASRLLGGSLDYDEALADLSGALVPDFTDWCVVHLARRDGTMRRVSPREGDPERQAVTEALARVAPPANWQTGSNPILDTIKAGRSVLVSRVTDDWLATAVADERYRRVVVERMGPRSLVVAPLTARGVTIGAMTFVSTRPGREYMPDDVTFAEDIAGRVALAIDNARLFRKVQQAGADAEQASEAKDEFLAMLAHELRTPLGAITTATALLANQADGSVGLRARETIKRQAERLARLTDDLLDVARVTSGTIVLARQPVNVADIVERCVRLLDGVGKLAQHRLELDVDPVWVEGDAARLEQVICNLLENSAKYTPENGLVSVRVTDEDGSAVIEVRDTGIGIAPELLPHVFDMFRQGARDLDRRQGGLGIGLTLVRRLVELHGGTIDVQSAGMDQGSVFTVRIPRIASPADSVPAASAVAGSGIMRRRVLIVEDNADARDMLRYMLEAGGQDVAEAADGHEALRAVREFRPDIALIDIGLPGMDGFEVARLIRAGAGTARLRLIALTGYGQPTDRQRARDAGFDEHLVKPVDPTRLLDLIAGE